jgi:hypothetical protein
MIRSTPWSSQFNSPDREIHFDALRRVCQAARVKKEAAKKRRGKSPPPPPKEAARPKRGAATKAKVSGMQQRYDQTSPPTTLPHLPLRLPLRPWVASELAASTRSAASERASRQKPGLC